MATVKPKLLHLPKKDVWIVVPAFNESHYLPKVIQKIKKHTTNIIVVDDGSSDNTTARAEECDVIVLSHKINLGKGAALKTGCEYAFQRLDAKAIIMMDSDDQHDPRELHLFMEKLSQGFDIVFGVRELWGNMPIIRLLGNKAISWLTGILYGIYIPDILSGYKALSRRGYELVKWQSTKYDVEMEIAARVSKYRYPFATVPIKTIYHDFKRGMTLLDACSNVFLLITWKMSI